MKNIFTWLVLSVAVVAAASGFAAEAAKEQNLLPADAEAAWAEVEKAAKPPAPPAEWAGKPPTEEQRKAFFKFLGEQSEIVASKAKEFYTRFPQHAKAEDAKEKEEQFRQQSKQFLGSSAPAEKISPEEEAFRKKMNDVQRRAMERRDTSKPRNGMADVIKEMEAGL